MTPCRAKCVVYLHQRQTFASAPTSLPTLIFFFGGRSASAHIAHGFRTTLIAHIISHLILLVLFFNTWACQYVPNWLNNLFFVLLSWFFIHIPQLIANINCRLQQSHIWHFNFLHTLQIPMQYMFVVFSHWESNKVIVDLSQKFSQSIVDFLKWFFYLSSFVLDNYSHYFIVVGVKTFFNIFKPHNGFFSLVFVAC